MVEEQGTELYIAQVQGAGGGAAAGVVFEAWCPGMGAVLRASAQGFVKLDAPDNVDEWIASRGAVHTVLTQELTGKLQEVIAEGQYANPITMQTVLFVLGMIVQVENELKAVA